MGHKKAWVYGSSLPADLLEELRSDGYECPSSPASHASFEEKHAKLERHSLSASGDLESGGVSEWSRVSVAARAHELKTRMKKNGKDRRTSLSASNQLAEDTQKELGIFSNSNDNFRLENDCGGTSKTSRRASDSAVQYTIAEHKRTKSEPIVLNTVDDLLRLLEKMGRLQPSSDSVTSSSKATTPPGQSTGGSECRGLGDSDDEPFASHSSIESDTCVSDSDSILGGSLNKGTGAVENTEKSNRLKLSISSGQSAQEEAVHSL